MYVLLVEVNEVISLFMRILCVVFGDNVLFSVENWELFKEKQPIGKERVSANWLFFD